jgi:hypothetical protein
VSDDSYVTVEWKHTSSYLTHFGAEELVEYGVDPTNLDEVWDFFETPKGREILDDQTTDATWTDSQSEDVEVIDVQEGD